jgi:hypothetical protein
MRSAKNWRWDFRVPGMESSLSGRDPQKGVRAACETHQATDNSDMELIRGGLEPNERHSS